MLFLLVWTNLQPSLRVKWKMKIQSCFWRIMTCIKCFKPTVTFFSPSSFFFFFSISVSLGLHIQMFLKMRCKVHHFLFLFFYQLSELHCFLQYRLRHRSLLNLKMPLLNNTRRCTFRMNNVSLLCLRLFFFLWPDWAVQSLMYPLCNDLFQFS